MNDQGQQDIRRASQVTREMHDFHKDAWDKIDALERYAKQLGEPDARGRTQALKKIGETVGFIESDLWSHFKQEEEQVYSVLKQILPPNRRRSVTAMEKDHRTIGRLVAEIKRLLREAQSAGAPDHAKQISENCLRLVTVMRNHINKENLIYQELGEVP